jgi:hypothetical protein
MNHEPDLSAKLRAAGDAVHATPDLGEVEDAVRRRLARRRLTTGVVALMLVAGAGGLGFGIGRAAGSGSGGQLTAPSSGGPEDVPGTVEPPAENFDDSQGSAGAPTPATTIPASQGEDGGWGADAVRDQPELRLVIERVTAAGVSVRGLMGPDYGSDIWFEEETTGWQPAPWCYPGTEFRVGVAAAGLIDVTYLSILQPAPPSVTAWPALVGWADANPHRVLVVQAPGADNASVTYVDGATDASAVVDGLAVLVVQGRHDVTDYELSVTGPEGVATYSDLDPSTDPAWRAACEPPPPSLPDAGIAPDDPAVAEAQIRANFALVYDGTVPPEDKPDHLVDDWTGIREAQQQVSEGSFAEAAASAEFTVDDLVFTSPDEAWFRYRIDTSITSFSQRFGVARFIDGHWRIVRATVCQDLSLAGGNCEEGVSFRVFPGLASFEERWEDLENDVVAATTSPPAPD